MRIASTVLALALSAISSLALADVTVNDGFENGLGAWSVFGTASSVASPLSTEGSKVGLVHATEGGDFNAAQLQSFVGVFGDNLRTQPSFFDTFAGGSAISQSFNAKKGDLVSFDWRFVTNELQPLITDFSFVVLNGKATVLMDSNSSLPIGAGVLGFESATDWRNTTLVADHDGINTVSFGVMQTADTTFSSAMALDKFEVNPGATAPVPEPETWAMMMAGLGLLGFAARRRKAA